MAAGKRPPSNAMLYTLITFVGLFILTTVLAIIYYLKAEEYRTQAATLQGQRDELASPAELRKIGSIVGAKKGRKSRLGTMVDYLDEMVSLTLGTLPEDTSAEVKVDTVKRKTDDTLELLAQEQFEQPETEDVGLKASAKEFVDLLVNGDFATATQNFDETMSSALPADKLEETWKLSIEQAGPFKQQIGVRMEKMMQYDVALVTCEFEKGPIDVKLVYDSEGNISGLFFIPTPPEVLEKFSRTPEKNTETKTESIDPAAVGLIRTIEKLKTKLDNTTNAALALQQQLDELRNRFDDVTAASLEKEQTLLTEKEKFQQQVNDIKQDYNELKALMKQTSDQQVQNLMEQLDDERADRKRLNQKLLKTEAELKMAENRMKRAQEKLQALVPPPDSEVAAYKSDGKVILIDDRAKIVHLNIGSDDRVYRGLTFSIYEKNMPIPKDGKGKAEIEVFNVGKTFSAARIIRSEIKRPIIADDIVANLIWDSDKTNVFVVVGEFDLNYDGNIDYDAVDKIKALIKKWGGRVDDDVSIDTDFIVLGRPPQVLGKPTFEQMEVDPMAMDKYEASLQNLAHYKEVQTNAKTLFLPVFNAERFLYFIGYKEQSTKAGAF
ncbi:MAG: DUF3887 domain-containing protein [Planctomycetota bacterium]|jgi:hypothetical protein